MYTNNVLARSQSSARQPQDGSGVVGHQDSHSASTQAAADRFKACLMEQIAYIPAQPFSLPPSFITDFVRRCFTEDICLVDFTQALTAMDYLKDLENRRKREMSAALHRLNVDATSLGRDREALMRDHPELAAWVINVAEKAKRIEDFYSQVYIGLRRWTLINEMRLAPFNKSNCIAMLNTLYPPTYTVSPAPRLSPTLLESQRNAFFRYILAVEQNGKDVLRKLEQQGRRPSDDNAWPIVREIVDKYLRTTNSLIQECVAISSPEDFEVRTTHSRVDSGISLSPSRNRHPTTYEDSHNASHAARPSTSSGVLHDKPSARPNIFHSKSYSYDKPLPPQPEPKSPKKGGSTLERIAREIKRIKSRNAESKDDSETNSSGLIPGKSLKKMKSTGTLVREGTFRRKHSRGGSGGDKSGSYDIDEEERARMIKQAKLEKENTPPKTLSPTQLRSRDWYEVYTGKIAELQA